jgi:subtilisin family serine protease
MSKYTCKLFPFEKKECISIQDVKQNAGWNITAFDLPTTWQHTQGEGVVIAVIDTGVDITHTDLVDNLLPGINLLDSKKPPIDGNAHGSHVSGILVASNNDFGVVGVCPKAKVLPIKALSDKGIGNMLDVAKGIRWAVEQKADIICMSLGTPNKLQEVRKAIQFAYERNIPVFVAAGNQGETKEIFYPANYPETIAIGAIDENFHRASFSNTGENLDFMAPGVNIISTFPNNWYGTLSGTSSAAPFAAGVAALLLSYIRNKKPDNLKINCVDDYREILRHYTMPIPDTSNENRAFYEGLGIIDPRKLHEALN